ncbi:MAG TPA: discoidin domain-containing protein, partial [Actinokineospora sp.]|nr:discoidin domain-containing protein [Actinokineospora sp.]
MPRWWPVPLAVVALGAAALVAPVLVSTPAEAATPAGVNVARGATATQSSTEYGGVAARAVDGNTNGTFTGNSVSHTTSQSQAWLSVDLRQVQQLTDVVVWNRTDCCTTRLADFYVLASDNPITSTNLTTARAQTGVSSYHVSSLT